MIPAWWCPPKPQWPCPGKTRSWLVHTTALDSERNDTRPEYPGMVELDMTCNTSSRLRGYVIEQAQVASTC